MTQQINEMRSLLSHLYTSCRVPLLRFLQSKLGDRHAAEEAMQESFTRFTAAAAAAGAAPIPDKQRPYLFQIAANLLRDQARERMRRGQPAMSLDDEALTAPELVTGEAACPSSVAEHKQRLERLRDALVELPERQREAFVLHRFDGLTQDEVAQHMGISRRMVVKHLARAFAYCELRVRYASQAQMQEHRGAAGTDPSGGEA